MESNPPLPLTQTPCDQIAVIASVEAPPEDATRLMALGLCVGRKVLMVKQGDPIVVEVLGTRIGLSARLAELVMLQPGGETSTMCSAR